METFIRKDFKVTKRNWGIEYLTKKAKLLGRKPNKIRIGDEIFTYYRSEHMPLSGMKYIYTNKENIAIFW